MAGARHVAGSARTGDDRAVPSEVDVLVIGAGPTGLGAATRLQQERAEWLLLESGSGPGGLASSVVDSRGFSWDLGGHVLHSHFPDFDKAVAESGVEMLSPRRNGWVWLDGQLIPAPIQHQLQVVPPDLDPDGAAGNLAEFYRNHLGADLLSRFFRPFTEKMWATPLEQMDHRWTSLRSGSAERNVPAVRVRTENTAPVVIFPYPAGGTGALWKAIAAGLDQHRMRYATSVVGIDDVRHIALLDSGRFVRYEQCISTMPLPALLQSVGDPELAALAPRLLSNESLVIGIGFHGAPPDALADKSWLYCPDENVAWHRATMLSNYDSANAGPDRWSILFEIGRSAFRRIDDRAALASVRTSLLQLGADLAAVASTWIRVLPMGYPIPTLGRDELLHHIADRLEPRGIRSRGRFGGWRYESCNQDYSFGQGVQAAAAIVDGSGEDVYWHPERF